MRAALRGPARTAPWFRSPSRTEGCGTPNAIAEGDGADHATTLASAPIGPYQLQAAIAAVHDEAARAEDTDWPQILGLYELLAALRARTDGHPQPHRRHRHGPRPAGRLDAAACSGGRPRARRTPPGGCRPCTPARACRRTGRRPRGLPAGRSAARTAFPNSGTWSHVLPGSALRRARTDALLTRRGAQGGAGRVEGIERQTRWCLRRHPDWTARSDAATGNRSRCSW